MNCDKCLLFLDFEPPPPPDTVAPIAEHRGFYSFINYAIPLFAKKLVFLHPTLIVTKQLKIHYNVLINLEEEGDEIEGQMGDDPLVLEAMAALGQDFEGLYQLTV